MDTRIRALAVERLKGSGLPESMLDALGMEVVEDASVLSPSFKPRPALVIKYFDPTGAPLSPWPMHPQFYRVRYLGKDLTPAAVLGAVKEARYAQPPGTLPCAYYPKSKVWRAIADDASQTLILTEGEIKAAASCYAGFPCIGIGGVDSWRALKHGVEWLDSLARVKWLGRKVIIVFDSDLKGNDNVARALKGLADQLTKVGAYPHIAFLPTIPQCEKTGLDDYLVHCGGEAFLELLQTAEPIGLGEVLWQLNTKYTYVKDPGLIYAVGGQKITPGAFKEHLESTKEYLEPVVQADGSIRRRPSSAGAAWLKWPMRSEAERLTYAPGDDKMTPAGELNTWSGWGIEPKPGDVTPFLQLLEHLFRGADPGSLDWFLKWLAYPIQHPGVKMYTSAVVWGPNTGTGKSLVGYTMARIYGKNFIEIHNRHLEKEFNEWAVQRQFVMADDISGHEKRYKDADHIKKLITQATIEINQKFVPAYVLPDCINYYITSNHPDALFLEDDDRRFFVHEVVVGSLPAEFYDKYDAWYKSDEGAAALFDYLLKLDLGDWNPRARAPKTAAKSRMMLNGMSDVGLWVRQLLDNPDHVLQISGTVLESDIFTSAQLLTIYDPHGRGKVGANGIARELGRCGVRQLLGGRPIKTKNGAQGRYFAVRNREKWESAAVGEIVDHLEQSPMNKAAKF